MIKKLGGGKSLDSDTQLIIESFLKSNSSIASNRTTHTKINDVEIEVPVRYLDKNLSETFNNFPNPTQLSKTTFIKYLKKDGIFKNPFRVTDLCDYCEWCNGAIVQIKDALKDFEDFENFEYPRFIEYLERKKNIEIPENNNQEKIDFYNNLIEKTEKVQLVLAHRFIQRTQRNAYNQQRKSKEFLRGKILIEIDYKQKINIGLSPRQVNKEYYNQELRSCLGNKIQIFLR